MKRTNLSTRELHNFINTVKENRLKLGITATELSEKTGISQSCISYIENSNYIPNADIAYKLATFFKIEIDQLFKSKQHA